MGVPQSTPGEQEMIVAKILVIEDNIADINLLRLALDQRGEKYELQVLNSGDDAIRFIQEQRTGLSEEPEKPCVILLDLHLPKYTESLSSMRSGRRPNWLISTSSY
jgi:CheY-like chemotaxis protein